MERKSVRPEPVEGGRIFVGNFYIEVLIAVGRVVADISA